MDIQQSVITVLTGMLGTLGFSVLFRSNKNRIICNAIGGALTCVVYVICCNCFEQIFVQNFFPALFVTAYAETMARTMKAPATPILACSIIPLVPGGKLYYTTYYFVINDALRFDTTLTQTLQTAAGLAVGIICVTVVVHEINRQKSKHILDEDF